MPCFVQCEGTLQKQNSSQDDYLGWEAEPECVTDGLGGLDGRSRRQSIRLMKWAFFATSLARSESERKRGLSRTFPHFFFFVASLQLRSVRPGREGTDSFVLFVMQSGCYHDVCEKLRLRWKGVSLRPSVRPSSPHMPSFKACYQLETSHASPLHYSFSPSLGLLQTNALKVS